MPIFDWDLPLDIDEDLIQNSDAEDLELFKIVARVIITTSNDAHHAGWPLGQIPGFDLPARLAKPEEDSPGCSIRLFPKSDYLQINVATEVFDAIRQKKLSSSEVKMMFELLGWNDFLIALYEQG